jgi:acyl-CoA hydrolase
MALAVGEVSRLVMPHMANILGDLFGGDLLAMIDQAAAIAALRHAGGPVVTAAIHRVDFRERIPVGALVTCRAQVECVGTSSMDITVEVTAELPSLREVRNTHTAHLVFVAIDANTGRPVPVGELLAQSPAEVARQTQAAARRKARTP